MESFILTYNILNLNIYLLCLANLYGERELNAELENIKVPNRSKKQLARDDP
jgi:hypothetical protein